MPVMGSCCAVNFTGKKLQKTKTTLISITIFLTPNMQNTTTLKIKQVARKLWLTLLKV